MSILPPGPYLPTNALVARAWLGTRVPGLTPSMVATSLPRALETWADLGFVQLTVIPGTPDIDTGARHPLIQIDAWAHTPDSVKPPVAKANRLAELIVRATENDVQVYGGTLDLGAHYSPARVLAAYPRTEPAEVPDDPSGYARVTFDLALDWARV